MKLDANAFAIASAATAGILWIVCSVIVLLLPGPMLQMSGYMAHGDLSAMNLSVSLVGVLLGFIGWVVAAALAGWILAVVYNRVAPRSAMQ
jgi:hypothetical protein